jgi:hypothetical protein
MTAHTHSARTHSMHVTCAHEATKTPHLIRMGQLFEFFNVTSLVRVMLDCELSVGLLDFGVRSIPAARAHAHAFCEFPSIYSRHRREVEWHANSLFYSQQRVELGVVALRRTWKTKKMSTLSLSIK